MEGAAVGSERYGFCGRVLRGLTFQIDIRRTRRAIADSSNGSSPE
jgi:hypothetical protein